ncbi:serine/threonine protein kinase [Aspergillus ibericus CBS 121593]|uniref:Serine/threonine protein kinase n=1 Tax=Aspergillus ibericus CBS 121593 TaxID=1448316 RepID=A0A395H947_9EURO|nr:serine/threonine protein kinase [Aspergillus ibericus CBS 121593]RAL04200.1 serine/threonine protein kinase [Aspergillus ibericus CBS 121593]
MASSLFRIGQVLRGKSGRYTIAKHIRDTIWLAKTIRIIISTSNQAQETVIIKSVLGHPRVQNERDILKRFQNNASCLRPLLDEIEDPPNPTTIVLKHLEDDLLRATKAKPLNQKELKYVSKRILEALSSLHEGGYVHADIKPDNIFVNYTERGPESGIRFSEVQLGDLGGTCHIDSKWAKSGTPLGAPMWRSPEMIMETPWGTPTDIWSFGAMLIYLIYGGDFNLFDPTSVPYGHEEYSLEVLKQQFRYFGPWPGKYEEIASPETVHAIMWIMQEIPKSDTTPFSLVSEKEVRKEDKDFIMGIMKMDWRDRPTARELLGHEWFKEIANE